MPKVYNKYHGDAPSDAVYIGRPTKWGNPFSHLPKTIATYKVATREDAVAMYKQWLKAHRQDLVEAAKKELKDKDLVCWCAPKSCHGDVLLEIANE